MTQTKKQLNDFKKRAIRHGELLLVPVDKLPEGAQQVFEGEKHICSHSETGHHHIAVGELRVFNSGGNSYLQMLGNGVLKHEKTFDFHATKEIFKGIYQISIKRAYDYFAKRMENVRD